MTPSQSLRNMETGVHLTVQKYRGEYKKKIERQEKSGKYDRRKAKRFRKRACPEAARHFRPAILPLSKPSSGRGIRPQSL